MGEIDSDHIGYNLLQDKGDEYDPIKFWQYLANMAAQTGKYAGDQWFHLISCDKDPTTVHFMFFTHNKV